MQHTLRDPKVYVSMHVTGVTWMTSYIVSVGGDLGVLLTKGRGSLRGGKYLDRGVAGRAGGSRVRGRTGGDRRGGVGYAPGSRGSDQVEEVGMLNSIGESLGAGEEVKKRGGVGSGEVWGHTRR